jgi:chromosome segregation ATPase
MLKKLVILGIVGFVAVSAVKGSKIGSYIRSEFASWREEAESKIAPEREIARLRNEVKLLDKDIIKLVDQLARERVAVRELQEKADTLRAQQSKGKELLNARAAAIKNAAEQVTFGNRKLSVPDAKADLEEGVRVFTANQKSLDAMDTAIGSRVKVKEGLEKQLDTMKAQKQELTAAIDSLEAELTALKLSQMESKYQTDDTRLAKIKEDIRGLRNRMEVEREKLKLLPAVFDSGSAKGSANKSVDDIMAPLATPADQNAAKVPNAD